MNIEKLSALFFFVAVTLNGCGGGGSHCASPIATSSSAPVPLVQWRAF